MHKLLNVCDSVRSLSRLLFRLLYWFSLCSLSFSPSLPPNPRPSPLFPPASLPPNPPQVLPYWGTLADRKTLRRLLMPSRLYGRAAPFHVCLTSYQMAVADEAVLKKVKWQFMILDEAQVCVGRSVQREGGE